MISSIEIWPSPFQSLDSQVASGISPSAMLTMLISSAMSTTQSRLQSPAPHAACTEEATFTINSTSNAVHATSRILGCLYASSDAVESPARLDQTSGVEESRRTRCMSLVSDFGNQCGGHGQRDAAQWLKSFHHRNKAPITKRGDDIAL